MKPIVAIVGRPNVGKSTLFNRIVGKKAAIVLDTPGVTRDRNIGDATWAGIDFSVVDTGGFEPEAESGILASMRRQALLAIEEAEAVIFVVDVQSGILPADREVAQILRQYTGHVLLAVNKVDGQHQDPAVGEFYELGVDRLFAVSAEHGRGVGLLLDALAEILPPYKDEEDDDTDEIRVALLGRPNVGKSTLTNRLLGEERMIVDSVAGTTRDAIDSVLELNGKRYVLIDTAGLRRSRGIDPHSSEGYSVMRTLRAIERCHVAIVLIDGPEGPTEQDARIVGMANEKGRGLILAVNKWDLVHKESKTAQNYREQLELKMPFASYAPVTFISGLTGQRVSKLLEMVDQVREAHRFRATTGLLNRWLQDAMAKHSPPVVNGRRLRLYYATQARIAPPTIVVSCNDENAVHFSYKRFLLNQFREAFPVEGTPVRLVFRGKKNPFDMESEE